MTATPTLQPFYIRREWNHFLQRFSLAPLERKTLDEPILSLQRNVFFHKRDEAKLRDAKVRIEPFKAYFAYFIN